MITTERLKLRPLKVEDASGAYLSWFSGQAADRISSSRSMQQLQDLRDYIARREDRDDVLFLGLFERDKGRHVGNLKYEPVLPDEGTAVLGIFIGEPSARGKGYAVEAIRGANAWLKANRAISQVVLGAEDDNLSAIRSYEKLGFVRRASPLIPASPNVSSMVLEL
jgi:ribosomal-protein-alanine N-acetyltransferase